MMRVVVLSPKQIAAKKKKRWLRKENVELSHGNHDKLWESFDPHIPPTSC